MRYVRSADTQVAFGCQMGQSASRTSDAQAGMDEEVASNSPRLLSEDSDEECRGQDNAAPNPLLTHLPHMYVPAQ